MGTWGLIHCADQTLGDCAYRRVGERELPLEMLALCQNTCASIQQEADTTSGIQACRG